MRPLVAPLFEMKFDFSDQGNPEDDHVGQHHEQDNGHDDPAQVKLSLRIDHVVCEPGQCVGNQQNAELIQDLFLIHQVFVERLRHHQVEQGRQRCEQVKLDLHNRLSRQYRD